MNLRDENIDLLFRKSAENVEAPEYNDAYWTEMNQLIDADQKSRKKLVVWTYLGTLGAILIIFLLFSNRTEKDNNALQLAEKEELVSDRLDNHSKSINKEGTKQNAIQKTNKEEELKSELKNKESKSQKVKEVVNSNPSAKSTAKNKTKTASLPSNSGEGFLNKADSKNVKQKQHTPPKNPDLLAINRASHLNTSDQQEVVEAEHLEVWSSLPVKLIPLNTETEINSNLIPLKNLMDRWRVTYHTEFAFGVSESYQSNTSSPWRYSLAGVVRFENRQLVINTGFGIQVETPANLQITERAKVYGFGLKNYENILNYKSFTQLYIPLEVGYKSNNSTFGVGGQFHSIVGTRMSLTSKVNQVITAQNDFKNQMAGLNRFSGNFYLWIDQQLTDKVSAGVRVGSAIGTRIADSHYFNTVTNEQPIFGQITLKYQLFK